MTAGSPPSMVAMTEFVVPRSIPIIRAMCRCSFLKVPEVFSLSYRRLRLKFGFVSNLDHRRPEHLLPLLVAGLVDLDNDILRAAILGRDGFMIGRIEWLPMRLDRRHAFALEQTDQFLFDELNALHPGCRGLVFRHVCQRA